jgi:deoxyribonuclease V
LFEELAEDQLAISRAAEVAEEYFSPDSVLRVAGCSQLAVTAGRIASCVACFDIHDLRLLEASWAVVRTDFGYAPAYLAYREAPPIVKAVEALATRPDLLLVPAGGVDHPRRIGMARHLGYLLSLPTIGVTRRPLVDSTPASLRPGPGRAPIYISRGWGLDSRSSFEVVGRCMRNHRMPEPIHGAKLICRRMVER